MALGADFRRLLTAYAASEAGTGIAFGALPLIAIVVLKVPEYQVSLLAAGAGLAAAVLALPAGPWIEFRRKRPIMIGADLSRFGALMTVPLAAALGVLSYPQLCLVAMVQAAGAIAFASASGAHLKALVAPADRPAATGRFEATLWTAFTAGPPIGGALTSALGPSITVGVDAVSYLLSALGVRSLRSPEKPPPVRPAGIERRQFAEIAGGWRYIAGHRGMRALFLNAQVFGAPMVASVPLLNILMLRDLHFSAWQYGVAWGVPCMAGVLGSIALGSLTRRFGLRQVLLASGVMRAMWLGVLAFMPAGPGGLVLIVVIEFLALFGTGVFNPAFATYRMEHTEDGHLSRVIACWSISSRTIQPVGIVLAGALAAVAGVRPAILVCGAFVLASVFFLPWRRTAVLAASA